jgi:hypothetical protein
LWTEGGAAAINITQIGNIMIKHALTRLMQTEEMGVLLLAGDFGSTSIPKSGTMGMYIPLDFPLHQSGLTSLVNWKSHLLAGIESPAGWHELHG